MLKKMALVAGLLCAGVAHAWMPQAGTWVIDAENNGKPGRGFGLDVQNETLVMQMYAYDANGSPTFYLSAGRIADNSYSGALNKYAGGRYFGSGDLSGRETGNAGIVKLRFVSGTEGFVQFPGEAEKAISRFNFGYSTAPESLRGIWTLVAVNTTSHAFNKVDVAILDKLVQGSGYGTGGIASTNGDFICENLTKGPNAGLVMCLKFNAGGTVNRTNFFRLSVNEGEGSAGNGGSTSSLDDVLMVKRVTNAAGAGVGILYKNQPAEAATDVDASTYADALREAAETPVDRSLLVPTIDDFTAR